MTDSINLSLTIISLALTLYNLRAYFFHGRLMEGKIARALGPFGYLGLLMACIAMTTVGVIENVHGFLAKAGTVLLFIIAVDNFLNGNDPPKRRRRE